MSQAKAEVTKNQRTNEQRQQAETRPEHGGRVAGAQLGAAQAALRRAQAASAALRPADVVALQRVVGNRRVQGLVGRDALAEEMPRSKAQTKLTVGASDDIYEQEADRLADQVMRMADLRLEKEQRTLQTKALATYTMILVQRQLDENENGKVQAKEQPGQTPTVTPDLAVKHEDSHIRRAGSPPEPITPKTARNRISGKYVDYLIRDDIQWHFNVTGWFVDLVISFEEKTKQKYSEKQISETSVAVLEASTGVKFKGGKRAELIERITKSVAELGSDSTAYLIPFDYYGYFVDLFEDPTWTAYVKQLKLALGGEDTFLNGQLFASGNFDTGAKSIAPVPGKATGAAKPKQPDWVGKQKKQLDALITEARQQTPRPKDLPDQLVVWYNEQNDRWYINVWVYFDTRGKQKTGYPLRLKSEESAEQLFARVRIATLKALQRSEDKQQRQREEEMPRWAQEIKRNLEKRLTELRRQEEATDFPDGLALALEKRTEKRSEIAGSTTSPVVASDKPRGLSILLKIWIERGSGAGAERNYGIVPWPLTPKTTVDDLVPYVRHLSAILRQFEQVPLGQQPPENIEITPPDAKGALAAFPAQMVPIDLRADNITVTGANNKFNMQLDYEAVYGGGPLKDLYIASKLYQQYIHFYWKIYKAPATLQPEEGKENVSIPWGKRWQELNESFNPDLNAQYKPASNMLVTPKPTLGMPVYETDSSDPTSRVKFPEEPGDYLVFCQTGHAAIGEHKLKRRSSTRYYPVRVKPIKEVVGATASLRPEAIKATEAELNAIEDTLAGASVDETEKHRLLALQQVKKSELEHLQTKEKQTLTQSVMDEVRHATEILKKVDELAKLLPDIIKRSKAEGSAPSELLKDKPELYSLYWRLISESKTVTGYREELKSQIKQLKEFKARSGEFQNELKPSSPYNYNPEAAFVSQVTGQVYPLVFMLEEAPDNIKNGIPGAVVVYSLVDITSSQTQKRYYGWSMQPGAQGHHEAIDNAFEDFGEDATYGEGLIAVRIPPGSPGANNPNHPGTELKYYKSKEGILQKVLWALGIIGAVAGIAALVATGVGAPAAAGILGAVAAGAGAIAAVHNITERSARHKLEWDAEMALDIISIIAVIPATAGARLARLTRTVAGFERYSVTARYLEIYGWTEMGATVILVPQKLAEDIQRIERDYHSGELTKAQRDALIFQAKLGAAQTGLMMVGAGIAARSGRAKGQHSISFEEEASLRQQIELLDLEGFGEYKSMTDRGLIDVQGNWTEEARKLSGATGVTKEVPPEVGKPPAKVPPAEPPQETSPTKRSSGKTPPEVAKPPAEPTKEAPLPKPAVEEAPPPKDVPEAPEPTKAKTGEDAKLTQAENDAQYYGEEARRAEAEARSAEERAKQAEEDLKQAEQVNQDVEQLRQEAEAARKAAKSAKEDAETAKALENITKTELATLKQKHFLAELESLREQERDLGALVEQQREVIERAKQQVKAALESKKTEEQKPFDPTRTKWEGLTLEQSAQKFARERQERVSRAEKKLSNKQLARDKAQQQLENLAQQQRQLENQRLVKLTHEMEARWESMPVAHQLELYEMRLQAEIEAVTKASLTLGFKSSEELKARLSALQRRLAEVQTLKHNPTQISENKVSWWKRDQPPELPVGTFEASRKGIQTHLEKGRERIASGEFDVVNLPGQESPMTDKSGKPILLPERVDLQTGKPVEGKKPITSSPDAISYKADRIVDDKPAGTAFSAYRQQMIRYIKAYYMETGRLPKAIEIHGYDPTTRKTIEIKVYTPGDFLDVKFLVGK